MLSFLVSLVFAQAFVIWHLWMCFRDVERSRERWRDAAWRWINRDEVMDLERADAGVREQ